jgi:hypothetical protein
VPPELFDIRKDLLETGAHGTQLPRPSNGQRISGERRAEGDERVRCVRVLGGVTPCALRRLR